MEVCAINLWSLSPKIASFFMSIAMFFASLFPFMNSADFSIDTTNELYEVKNVVNTLNCRNPYEFDENTRPDGTNNVISFVNYVELMCAAGGNYDPDMFKLYFADTGLLVPMLDEESQEDLRAGKNLGVYKGALYENIAGEALVKQGYKLCYYKRGDSSPGTDFLIRSRGSLIPIEVKAKNGKAKSAKQLINSDKYADIRYAFKFSDNNLGHENGFYTFPYFCTFY